MIENKKVVALIPARGGSKRLPNKNILKLMGKPLINWSIEAALECRYVDQVIVSTDSETIQTTAKHCGAYVPELRPDELSSDTATTEDVILYTLENHAIDADILILLQPTSPLRNVDHIDKSLELFIKKQAKSIVSVTPCEHPIQWCNTLPSNGSLHGFVKPESKKRSQDLEPYYRLNGAIYIYDVEEIRKEKRIDYYTNSYAFIMQNKYSIDIDNEQDFALAQFFLSRKR
ncbi:cytidylyltransferase domain-containing protein [Vibrio splendidus]|uniref:acylneuraminate cytidylyltransferase family protein n=1 Tax=Vibrio cyclitrophicus TaxID=47951 RepID=UPI000C83EFBB|nr:acylneuraminate cytidylyltransferase family protein [Vibrio cyclitrophicus]PMI45227.1 CMP-N-acetlyneuraminic acid synthetase [Vibrio cyclitrophicus]